MTFLLAIQRWLAIHQKQVRWVFSFGYVLLLAMYLFGIWWYTNAPTQYLAMYEVGLNMGILSAVLYVLTLWPGILKRLKLTSPISTSLMLFRRQIGVSMFLSALVHSAYTTVLPLTLDGQLGKVPFSQHQLYGMTALSLLLPLWLTSNDVSKRKLGKGWNTLHKLTYIALIFIYLHVSAMNFTLMIIVGITLLAELASWLVPWNQSRVSGIMKTENE